MEIIKLFISFAIVSFSWRHRFVVTSSSNEFITSLAHSPEEAKINVHRIKRFDTPDESILDPYSITVAAFNTEYQTDVEKSRHSIFTPDFKFETLDGDIESNTFILRDVTLTKDDLKKIEDGHYINSEKQASFSVRALRNAEIRKIRGIIEDIAIIDNGANSTGSSGVVSSMTSITNVVPDSEKPESYKDYLVPGPRPVKLGRTLQFVKRKAACEPELYVVYDYDIYNKFNGNIRDITDYTAILFHGVNNRYATMHDVKIKFRISGVRAMTSPGAQQFMEENKIPDGSGYDIALTLQKFSEYIYQNLANIPNHDLALFITAVDLQMKEESGNYQKATSGLAWIKGACFVDHSKKAAMGTSVSEDNGLYAGLYTITHELAHNLGADHDGNGASEDCDWKEGYIMSYLGYGTKNKFRFSKCSELSMKKLVTSSEGDCLRTFEYKKDVVGISKKNIGHKVTMKQMCQKFMNNANAIVDPDVDAATQCKNIHCKFINSTKLADGRIRTYTSKYQSNVPAGDDIPCGEEDMEGNCWDGECLQKLPRLLYRQ